MKKKLLKKILIAAGSVFLLLSVVLVIHIYQVTRPKVLDANAIAMARIDFKQDISQEDAAIITTWFNKQTGVQRFTCNTQNRNAVFTFFPAKMDASKTVETFVKELHYNAVRYMPSKDDMMKGCPVASNN